MQDQYFAATRVYPSDQGLHVEFATAEEARAFYEDSRSRGITSNELDGLTVIKKFRKKPVLVQEQAS